MQIESVLTNIYQFVISAEQLARCMSLSLLQSWNERRRLHIYEKYLMNVDSFVRFPTLSTDRPSC